MINLSYVALGLGQAAWVCCVGRGEADAARRFFRRALSTLKVKPTEVVTAAVYPTVFGILRGRATDRLQTRKCIDPHHSAR
jgi:hypothetical protein